MLHILVTRYADGRIIGAEVVPARNDFGSVESRWDWNSFEAAQEVAAALGAGYIATDAGPNVSPRYDVIELPKVGDAVSYGFNGDYYPCGEIVSISKSLKKITTSTGRAFFRRRLTGSWVNAGTWSLVPGHVNKRNPEF